MIFVCTNARADGLRISCAGKGRCGEQILATLKNYVKANRLEDRVRVAKSGCQEKCEIGPNAVVLPDNVMLSGLTPADAEKIISSYLADV
jgi:(2Fe-2S) ferredoxin